VAFLLSGGENEISVAAISGELSGHEVEDDDDEAPREEGFDPKGRPRGPKDAGGNR
jgi:hypothetical protein